MVTRPAGQEKMEIRREKAGPDCVAGRLWWKSERDVEKQAVG
jgi:hypothetical protein